MMVDHKDTHVMLDDRGYPTMSGTLVNLEDLNDRMINMGYPSAPIITMAEAVELMKTLPSPKGD